MSNILVVTGSVRPQSVNEKIVPLVVNKLGELHAKASVADLKELNLPLFDAPVSASNEAFAPTDKNVIRWTEMVRDADGVVFVTPEYNGNMSPVQLNAIDWIYKEWKDKPIALIGYGWGSGGGKAHDAAEKTLADTLKATVGATRTNLFFTKDIDPDGSIIDEAMVDNKISATLDELLKTVSKPSTFQ